MVQIGLDGVDQTGMELLCLVKYEERLGAPQHHVPDGFSQLALEGTEKNKDFSHLSILPHVRAVAKSYVDFIR